MCASRKPSVKTMSFAQATRSAVDSIKSINNVDPRPWNSSSLGAQNQSYLCEGKEDQNATSSADPYIVSNSEVLDSNNSTPLGVCDRPTVSDDFSQIERGWVDDISTAVDAEARYTSFCLIFIFSFTLRLGIHACMFV